MFVACFEARAVGSMDHRNAEMIWRQEYCHRWSRFEALGTLMLDDFLADMSPVRARRWIQNDREYERAGAV